MQKEHSWQLLALLALGVFLGSFWMIFGFLSVIGTKAAWYYYFISLSPGTAILFLVLMARRAPVPYGTGLMLLGLALALKAGLPGNSFGTGIMVGIPAFLLGLLFILFRKAISLDEHSQ